MGFFEGLKEKVSSEYEEVSKLQAKASRMDDRDLCRAFRWAGTRNAVIFARELKMRLETMPRSQKVELFNYCKENNLGVAANAIARSIKKG